MYEALQMITIVLVTMVIVALVVAIFFAIALGLLALTNSSEGNERNEENNMRHSVQWHYNDGRYVNDHYSKSFNTIEEAVSKYEELRAEYTQHVKDNFAFDMLTVEENDTHFKISYEGVVDIIVISIESDDYCDYHYFDVYGEFEGGKKMRNLITVLQYILNTNEYEHIVNQIIEQVVESFANEEPLEDIVMDLNYTYYQHDTSIGFYVDNGIIKIKEERK